MTETRSTELAEAMSFLDALTDGGGYRLAVYEDEIGWFAKMERRVDDQIYGRLHAAGTQEEAIICLSWALQCDGLGPRAEHEETMP